MITYSAVFAAADEWRDHCVPDFSMPTVRGSINSVGEAGEVPGEPGLTHRLL